MTDALRWPGIDDCQAWMDEKRPKSRNLGGDIVGKEPLTRTIVEVYVDEDGDVALAAPQASESLRNLLDGLTFVAEVADRGPGDEPLLKFSPVDMNGFEIVDDDSAEPACPYGGPFDTEDDDPAEPDEDADDPAPEDPLSQLDRLAKFILQRCPDRVTGGSAVDVAIRALGELLPVTPTQFKAGVGA